MSDRAESDVEVLDLFVIDDDTGELRTAEPWERTTSPSRAQAKAVSVDDTVPLLTPPNEQLSPVHTPPGPGQRPAVRPRPIGTFEIFHPILVAPMQARQLLLAGDHLDGIDGLVVDHDRRCIRQATMTWPVRVDTGWIGGRQFAELCVRPSPSWVLTVVELRPKRPSRLRSPRFLRAGVHMVEEICDRLFAAAAI